ncbi:MAG: hypothetical protein Q7T71_10500, partial [Herbiconiux sp.]|nr:hypothetical protein [Herbiconiux sp.]
MTEQSSSAPVARFTIAGDDVEYARQTYQDAYGGTHFSVAAPDRGFSFRYASIGDERVSLRTSTLDGSLRGEVPHLREYVVSWFRSGTGEVHRGRSSYAGGASLPFLLPSEQRFEFAFSPHRQNLIHFAPDFLEDVASELHAGRPQAVAFDHGATPAPDAVARWRA